MRVDRPFYDRDTVEVARELLGCTLVRKTEHGEIRVVLTETEAYKGAEDPASHASRGVTPRSRLMFGDTGVLYVYLIYGMHYCLNIVAHEPGGVGAVLLRGACVQEGEELVRANRPGAAAKALLNGPGKLAKGLGIGIEWNGRNLLDTDSGLWLERSPSSLPLPWRATPRIGISKGVDLPWRFTPEETQQAGYDRAR
ncbi:MULTISPECIES: DNA-3-methyladenine glycosylase [Paenibacillus]|uniref:DNA-3-methyladenine glycosylase n=1 Tax=Paenibacillus TaxID=44249 RepID=UPI0022B88F2E|nr:DNA-3-methyladenine glycosylase [Paenibacillus caseinilyticus]MCZ8521126.1 DNA-3-methyladenine glycosylase [Paenibacillus caseinilyticus]